MVEYKSIALSSKAPFHSKMQEAEGKQLRKNPSNKLKLKKDFSDKKNINSLRSDWKVIVSLFIIISVQLPYNMRHHEIIKISDK